MAGLAAGRPVPVEGGKKQTTRRAQRTGGLPCAGFRLAGFRNPVVPSSTGTAAGRLWRGSARDGRAATPPLRPSPTGTPLRTLAEGDPGWEQPDAYSVAAEAVAGLRGGGGPQWTMPGAC
jgi:hypothetical protein